MIVFAIVINVLAKRYLIVATVNGTPINRLSIVTELEKTYGKDLLERKIVEQLVLSEAQKQNLVVSEAEIDEEIASIKSEIIAQGQDFEEILKIQGVSQTSLRNEIKLQKLVESLTTEITEPNEEEIATLLEEQADMFPEDMTQEERRESIATQLKQQNEAQALQNLLTSLQENADIQYLIEY